MRYLLIVIFVVSVLLNIYLFLSVHYNSTSKKAELSTEPSYNSWAIELGFVETNLSTNETSLNCDSMLDWSIELEDIRNENISNLYDSYKDILNVIKYIWEEWNDYEKLFNLKKGNCDFYDTKSEYDICIDIRNKKDNFIARDISDYDKAILTSISSSENNCSTLKDNNDIEDCNLTFENFNNFHLLENPENIFLASDIQIWKLYSDYWKNKLIEQLNTDFVSKCKFYMK